MNEQQKSRIVEALAQKAAAECPAAARVIGNAFDNARETAVENGWSEDGVEFAEFFVRDVSTNACYASAEAGDWLRANGINF